MIVGAAQKDVSRKNSEGGGGWGRGWEWRFPPIYFSLPPFFFLRSLISRRTPLSERLHEGTTAKTKKQERRKRQKCFCAVQFYTWYISLLFTTQHQRCNTFNLPRAPAMNPKISAFSARLTRFAFLNISWAANIWSLWKKKENEKTRFPVHSHKQTWFPVILLQFATVSPGIHESQTRISES